MIQKRQLIFFVIFFVLYQFTTYIANDMIMPGMIQVIKEFHSSSDAVAKSLSLYIIGGGTLQLFLGPLCDIFGKKRMMLIGNLIFTISSAAIPFVETINQFLFARYLEGFGLCFIFIGYAMIHEFFNDKTAIKLLALIGNITIMAPLLGPIVGSGVTLYLNWRYIFVLIVIFSLVSLIGLFKFMPETASKPMNIKAIIDTYKGIFRNKIFLYGGLIVPIAQMPVIAWIGLAPVIVLKTMNLGYGQYNIFQIYVFGGFVLSGILLQFITAKISFTDMIKIGSTSAVIGVLISYISNNTPVYLCGMCLISFGISIVNATVMRIALTSTGASQSMASAGLNIIIFFVMAFGLELINQICAVYGYNLHLLAIINTIDIILCLILCRKFSALIKDRSWR